MLDQTMTAQLSQYLGNLREGVELVASLDDSEKSAQTRELLTEIASLHDDVTASFDGDDARRPSFIIRRASAALAAKGFSTWICTSWGARRSVITA